MNKEQKKAYLVIRCTEKEKASYKHTAWENKLSLAKWVRQCLSKFVGKK